MPVIQFATPTPAPAAAGECGRRDLTRCAGGLGEQRRPGRPADPADDPPGEGRAAVRHLRLRADGRHDQPGRRRAQPEGARGRQRQGADREVPPRRHHLLRLVEQRGQPAADRRAVQRPAAGRHASRARTSRCSSPPTRSTASSPGSGRRPPSCPGNMALGAGRSETDTYDAAQISGKELRAIGINQNFAPDADVNVNAQNPVIGVRSFGSDPSLVSSLVSASVAGYQNANVSSTAKHFPGHGDTATDSHFGVPIINHSRVGVGEHRRSAVPRGDQARHRHDHDRAHRGAVARPVGHTGDAVRSRSSPTSCAASWATTAWSSPTRSTMQGVRDDFGDDRIPVLALKAGVDQLLMPAPGKLDIAYNAVLDAVRSGELTEKRIDQSVASRPAAEDEARPVPARERHGRREEGRLPGRHRRAPGACTGDHRRHRHTGQGRREHVAAGQERSEGARHRRQHHAGARRPAGRARSGGDGVQHRDRADRRGDRAAPWRRRSRATRSSWRPTRRGPAPASRSW